jgi:hypothetical protein
MNMLIFTFIVVGFLCSNLEKVLPNETEAPEENTFVGDALIKPVGADMLGEQYSPNNMITKAPNKPSIRVAAENLSPESETCLEKCINLGNLDVLSAFISYLWTRFTYLSHIYLLHLLRDVRLRGPFFIFGRSDQYFCR